MRCNAPGKLIFCDIETPPSLDSPELRHDIGCSR
jgi:hypothetical protein